MTTPTHTSNKSAAESAMERLSLAMDRNPRIIEAQRAKSRPEPAPVSAAPNIATALAPGHPAPAATDRPRPARGGRHPTTGVRFTPGDQAKINAIVNQALSLGERIHLSVAVRLALEAYDPRTLTRSDVAAHRQGGGTAPQ